MTSPLRRPLAIAGLAGLVAGGAASLGVGPLRVLPVSALFCPQPSISAVGVSGATTSQHGPVGSTVVITGSGFNSPLGCSTTLTVKIGNASWSVDDTRGSSTSQSFTLSQAADGNVSVTNGDGGSATGPVFVTNPAAVSLPPTPHVGQALSASGSGLDLGGQLSSASASWHTIAGTCPSSSASVASGGGSVSIPALGSYCRGTATLTLAFKGSNGNVVTVPMGGVDVAPTFTSTSPTAAPAGSTVTVNGSGFGPSGSATVGGLAAPSSWSDTAVAVTLPDGATGGAVSIARPDGVSVSAGTVTENARIDSLSPSSGTPGTNVTVAGGGFGSTQGSLSLGGAPVSPTTWSATSVSFQIPVGAHSGSVTLTPASGGAASAPFNVDAVITGLNPTHAQPGAVFEIDGSGFGTAQGTVTVGGKPASVSLWGDGSIVATVPDGLRAGSTTVTVQPPGTNAPSTSFTIDAGHASSAAGVPGSASSSTSSSSRSTYQAPTFIPPSANGPIISTAPIQFQKPPAPAGPVRLTLSSTSDAANPGATLPLDVTLVAFGKPVSGAKVAFQLVVEPGRDATIDPAEAVTDEAGHAKATLHLSATSGDHIILATSGQYSDEIRVVGNGDAGAVAAISGAGRGQDVIATVSSGPPKFLVVGALLLCVILFVTGFAIHMFLPRGRATATAAASTEPGATVRAGFDLNAIGERFATVLQFAATTAFVVAVVPSARLARRLRKRG